MSTHQKETVQEPAISDKEVAQYLCSHPDFFDKHTELVSELKLRHPTTGQSISLIERQVTILREQKKELDQKLRNLIRIARDNDSLHKRMQKMTLALMEAESLGDVFSITQELLRIDFNADSIVIRLFTKPKEEPVIDNIEYVKKNDPSLEIFEKFFETRKPICGRLNQAQSDYLFGDNAGNISSAALIPICDRTCFGMLAIGSEEHNRFHHSLGTLFLSHMGEVIGRSLRPYFSEGRR